MDYLAFNKLKKSLILFSASVSAVPETLTISSCNVNHLFFRNPANPHFKFNFVDFTFLSIVLTCVKFSFLAENCLGSRDI